MARSIHWFQGFFWNLLFFCGLCSQGDIICGLSTPGCELIAYKRYSPRILIVTMALDLWPEPSSMYISIIYPGARLKNSGKHWIKEIACEYHWWVAEYMLTYVTVQWLTCVMYLYGVLSPGAQSGNTNSWNRSQSTHQTIFLSLLVCHAAQSWIILDPKGVLTETHSLDYASKEIPYH